MILYNLVIHLYMYIFIYMCDTYMYHVIHELTVIHRFTCDTDINLFIQVEVY